MRGSKRERVTFDFKVSLIRKFIIAYNNNYVHLNNYFTHKVTRN